MTEWLLMHELRADELVREAETVRRSRALRAERASLRTSGRHGAGVVDVRAVRAAGMRAVRGSGAPTVRGAGAAIDRAARVRTLVEGLRHPGGEPCPTC